MRANGAGVDGETLPIPGALLLRPRIFSIERCRHREIDPVVPRCDDRIGASAPPNLGAELPRSADQQHPHQAVLRFACAVTVRAPRLPWRFARGAQAGRAESSPRRF